jgi:transcriptional regulator with XRE-family HTH domain
MVSEKPELEPLGEFVARVRSEKNMTRQLVADKSRGGISAAYISKIENDPSVQPSVRKLQSLALGLGENEETVINIARGRKEAPTNFDKELAIAASGYENWTEDERRRFIEVVKTVAAGIRATHRGA